MDILIEIEFTKDDNSFSLEFVKMKKYCLFQYSDSTIGITETKYTLYKSPKPHLCITRKF